jgi:hypothetical protein
MDYANPDALMNKYACLGDGETFISPSKVSLTGGVGMTHLGAGLTPAPRLPVVHLGFSSLASIALDPPMPEWVGM